MTVEPIQSAQNAKLKAIRALRAGKEREATVLEGRHLLEEALDAQAEVPWVLVEASVDLDDPLLVRANEAGAEVHPCRSDLLQEVSRLEDAPDLLAWVQRPSGDWREALAEGERGAWWLVAAGVQDPGNLGALARVAAGFGAAGLLCLKGGASPWHPRALRGASGTTFRLPVFEGIEAEALVETAAALGVELWGTEATGEDLAQVTASGTRTHTVAVLLGEEGRGLDPGLAQACRRMIGIPLARGVESLNVATAAAVVGWALRSPVPVEG